MGTKTPSENQVDVCLIVEGCYPFVTGGVASWVHRLLHLFPKISFGIVALTAGPKRKTDFKYILPPNVKFFKSFDILDFKIFKKANSSFTKNLHYQDITSLMLNGFPSGKLNLSHKVLLKRILENYGAPFFKEILTSEEGFKIITAIYERKRPQTGFLKYYYNWRNIHLVIWKIFLIARQLPKAKLYHAPSTGFAGFLACLMTELYGIPSAITEHGIYLQERSMELATASWIEEPYLIEMWLDFFRSLTFWQYQRVNKLITLSYSNLQLQIEYGAPEEKIDVVPNGIQIERFKKARRKRPTFPPIVGTVARVDPVKDLKTFILVVNLLKKHFPKLKAYIVGPIEEDKNYYQECLKFRDELNLKDDIVFTGTREVVDYYRKFDLFFLTSIKEAQPLAVMEAMASGIPVIVTRVGSCEELVYGNDNLGPAGFVVPVGEAHEMARLAAKLLKEPETYQKFSQVGQKRIENFYQEEILKKYYANLYSSVISKRPF